MGTWIECVNCGRREFSVLYIPKWVCAPCYYKKKEEEAKEAVVEA